MKTRIAIFTSVILFIFMFFSCEKKQEKREFESGDSIKLSYSELLTITKHDGYTVVNIANPWRENDILHSYILIPDSLPIPDNLPEGTIVRTPITNMVVFTTAHASLMSMIGAKENIGGVADLKYMLLEDIQKRTKEGTIIDCGDAMSPNIERIIDMQADAILLSPFDNSGGYGRLEDIGIPIIECADYMETSALGRAEWMKFYGLLVDKENEADSLFTRVCNEYKDLKSSVSTQSHRPTILTERLTGAVWYVPGEQSSIGIIINDAKGTYPFANDQRQGSIALPFETVLEKYEDADTWIFNHFETEPMTYQKLLSEHHGYASFKAFKNRKIYYVNTSLVPYFEEVSFRPDYLLKEFIMLLHPETREKHGGLRYYKPLEE